MTTRRSASNVKVLHGGYTFTGSKSFPSGIHPISFGSRLLNARKYVNPSAFKCRKRAYFRTLKYAGLALNAGCRTVSNNGSGSGLAPAQNILAVQVWFGFT